MLPIPPAPEAFDGPMDLGTTFDAAKAWRLWDSLGIWLWVAGVGFSCVLLCAPSSSDVGMPASFHASCMAGAPQTLD